MNSLPKNVNTRQELHNLKLEIPLPLTDNQVYIKKY